jgi:hypothetical protein
LVCLLLLLALMPHLTMDTNQRGYAHVAISKDYFRDLNGLIFDLLYVTTLID